MQGDEHRGTLGTVRNATLLLSLLAEGPAYNQLTDLAERSGMSLPTVHRLLRSLALAGLVEQDPRSLRYSLGPDIVRLSERYLDRLPTLRALSPYLRELRDTTKTTILVALLVRTSIIYVDRVDGEEGAGVFREAHRVHPALDTAAGRRTIPYGALHAEVVTFADALRGLGVEPGDRVGLHLGWIPETVVARLACARLGAVHGLLPASLPADALADRLSDLSPKVLVT